MKRERHVIIGANLAGVRAAQAMRDRGFDGEIILVGAEPGLPYQRPPLSKGFLESHAPAFEEILVEPAVHYEEQRIELRLGVRARRLDVIARAVELDSGERLRFDRSLIATGAEPRRSTVPGSDLPGVLSLRTIRDASEIAARVRRGARVVVAGAGLVGLEVAAAARTAGCHVTVVEAATTPLRRVLGAELGLLVTRIHEDYGVAVLLGTKIARMRGGSEGVAEVELENGRILPADLVIVGIGVTPSAGWLRWSGIALDDGVVVDEHGQTNVPGVYAAGDVARAFNPLLGWHSRLETYGNAHGQGLAVGRNMVGGQEAYAPLPAASSDQFGHRLHMLGVVSGGDEIVFRGSRESRAFVAFCQRDGVVVGAFALNQAREIPAARKIVAARARVSPERLADTGIPLGNVV